MQTKTEGMENKITGLNKDFNELTKVFQGKIDEIKADDLSNQSLLPSTLRLDSIVKSIIY